MKEVDDLAVIVMGDIPEYRKAAKTRDCVMDVTQKGYVMNKYRVEGRQDRYQTEQDLIQFLEINEYSPKIKKKALRTVNEALDSRAQKHPDGPPKPMRDVAGIYDVEFEPGGVSRFFFGTQSYTPVEDTNGIYMANHEYNGAFDFERMDFIATPLRNYIVSLYDPDTGGIDKRSVGQAYYFKPGDRKHVFYRIREKTTTGIDMESMTCYTLCLIRDMFNSGDIDENAPMASMGQIMGDLNKYFGGLGGYGEEISGRVRNYLQHPDEIEEAIRNILDNIHGGAMMSVHDITIGEDGNFETIFEIGEREIFNEKSKTISQLMEIIKKDPDYEDPPEWIENLQTQTVSDIRGMKAKLIVSIDPLDIFRKSSPPKSMKVKDSQGWDSCEQWGKNSTGSYAPRGTPSDIEEWSGIAYIITDINWNGKWKGRVMIRRCTCNDESKCEKKFNVGMPLTFMRYPNSELGKQTTQQALRFLGRMGYGQAAYDECECPFYYKGYDDSRTQEKQAGKHAIFYKKKAKRAGYEV